MNKDLRIEKLTVAFGNQGAPPVVEDMSITFHAGQVTGVIGESGSGKSVMGMAVLRLLPPTAQVQGKIFLGDRELLSLTEKEMRHIRGGEIGLIPQNPADSLDQVMRVDAQIDEILKEHLPGTKQKHRFKINTMLKQFGFEKAETIARSYPFELSGGMKQRVVSIFGIAGNPKWIIADEPTKGLDAILRDQVYQRLAHISMEEIPSMLVITHDISMAAAVCDRIVVMIGGEIIEVGPSQTIIHQPKHPYTKGLLDCLPSRGLKEIVKLREKAETKGCVYYEKCPKAQNRCGVEKPKLIPCGKGEEVRCFYVGI